MDDGGSGSGFSRKVALGRLLPSVVMRDQIERTLEVKQTLAVRGSLVSTTILIRRLETGDSCPPVNDPSWWRRCICACGRLSAQDRHEEVIGPKKEAECVADELFADHPVVYYDHMWPFVSTIVNELIDATQRMIATVFHNSLTRAFWRELSLYEKQTSSRLEDAKGIVQSMVLRAVGHRFPRDIPTSCPGVLRLQLEALRRSWSEKYAVVLPLPTSQFCTAAKLPMIIEWLYDLEVHRRDCLQSMAIALPVHLPREDGHVETFFAEKSAKTQPLLPLCKVDIHHIAINPSTLKSLVNGAISRGEMSSDFHIKTTTAPLDAFLLHFPGLRMYQRQARCCGPDGRLAFCSFRTDGVVASVLFSSTIKGSVRGQKRKKEAKDVKPSSCFEEQEAVELREVAKCPVPSLVNKKRVVCIDPGSRDMIFAVIDETLDSGDKRTSEMSVPSTNFVNRTKRWAHRELGEASLRRTRTIDVHGRMTNLYDACCSLPTYRDVFNWSSYLSAYLPILDDLLRCKRRRALRRAQYDHYLRKDKVLDQVIRQLTGGSLSPSSCRETHIALGSAAACCSSGRGHDSAPLGRFRWRLEKVHKIDVTLIDEFRTSQNCSACRQARLYPVKMTDRLRGRVHQPSWVLKACPSCRNTAGTGPRIWHRDVNAALNIRACFYAQVAGEPRPEHLDRARARLPNYPSHFHSEILTRGVRREPSARVIGRRDERHVVPL